MLPSHIYGLKNEEDIINYLDGKRFSELNKKWKRHVKKMFPFISDKDLIVCTHYDDEKGKPDIVIRVRHTNVYISIKTGRKCSMHQEPFGTFKAFLEKNGVSNRTLRILELFQYGMTDKLSNNGKPFAPKELERKFKTYFNEASSELDELKIIDAVVFRCILKGCVMKRYKVNFLYYGNLETGYLLSEEDIYSLVAQYRRHEKTAIHFGGLNFYPSRRKRDNLSYIDCRIRWPILSLLYYRTEDEINDIVQGNIKV